MGSESLTFSSLPGEQSIREILNQSHFYAAYIFDTAEAHQYDITTIMTTAQQLERPVRYWWLSEVVDLEGLPDTLILCVHHPSLDEDAGMDLYSKLKEQQVDWDSLEAATLDEYRTFGKSIYTSADIRFPDGTWLFPDISRPDPSIVKWENPQSGILFRIQIDNDLIRKLSPVARERIQLTLSYLDHALIILLNHPHLLDEQTEHIGLVGYLAEHVGYAVSFLTKVTTDPKTMLTHESATQEDQDFPFLF